MIVRPVHLVYIVTDPMSARLLLKGQLAYMREQGFHVHVICSPGNGLDVVEQREGVKSVAVCIPREMEPIRDLKALIRLVNVLRRLRPDIVNASTPKAGLLGMLAAAIVGVPVRIYTLRGLRAETARGAIRALLHVSERIASACAHRVLAVSTSLAREYHERGLADSKKVRVLGAGSSNGVDTGRFGNIRLEDDAEQLRTRYAIPASAPVIGFVGRLTKDKGIIELFETYERVLVRFPNTRLLLVGDFEEGDPVPPRYVDLIQHHPQVVRTGRIEDSAPLYQLMDVLAFPSYREGFPNVPLEAGASGIPIVGFRVTGVVDAVIDGETGTLVKAGQVDEFSESIARYLTDPRLKQTHGDAGRRRATKLFQPERLWRALLDEYEHLLDGAGKIPEMRLPESLGKHSEPSRTIEAARDHTGMSCDRKL
jgi:glycosyltransferase involved in cell wall biosynthesis